jgi:hypothetical protein
MIVRTWRCRPHAEQVDAYYDYLTGTVFAGLTKIRGHRGAQLLRRDTEGRVEFVAVSYWDTVAAIKEYAGENIDLAMVKPEARLMLAWFDEAVYHYDLLHSTGEAKP